MSEDEKELSNPEIVKCLVGNLTFMIVFMIFYDR